MTPLYRKVLGASFEQLPEQLQKLHELNSSQIWRGTAEVRRGKNPLARIAALIIGLPAQNNNTPVTVTLSPENNGERWQRNFNGKVFSSFQLAGTGRHEGLLLERFGPMTIALELLIKNNRLYLIPRHWNLLGIPLPKILLPAGETFEEQRDGLFRFNVEMKAPLVGLIVSYKGALKQETHPD